MPRRTRRQARSIGAFSPSHLFRVILQGNLMLASPQPGCQEEARMRGVVFTGDRQLEMMNFPDPTPGDGEVVVEMKAYGMCGSDLHQYRRQKGGEAIGGLPVATEPVIAGHERSEE